MIFYLTIFGKFVTKTSNNVSGFGLGLYISKKIIDCHNGKIQACNQNGQPVFLKFHYQFYH